MSRSALFLCAVLLFCPTTAVAQTADPLAAIGRLLIERHPDEARVQLTELRERYIARNDVSGEAAACVLLALADITDGDGKSSRVHLAEAEAKYTTLRDYFGAWTTLWLLADLEFGDGHIEDATAIHERARALLAKADEPDARVTADSVKVIAVVYGAPPALLQMANAHGFMMKAFFVDFARAIEDDASAHLLIETGGDLQQAEELLQRAAPISTLFGGIIDMDIEAHTGELRQLQWRLEEAREHYVRAIEGSKRLQRLVRGGPVLELKIYGRLAAVELLSGRTDEALAWNDRALAVARAANEEKSEAGILEARADIFQKSGRYEAALAAYGESMKIAVALGDLDRQASLHAAQGTLDMFQGKYGRAVTRLETAIGLYQKLDQPLLESTTWMILADVHCLLDVKDSQAVDNARALAKKSRYKLAMATADLITTLQSAMRGTTRREDAEAAFDAWQNLGDTKTLMLGDVAELLRDSLRIASGEHSPRVTSFGPKAPQFIRWLAPMLRGMMEMTRGDVDAARRSLNEALALDPGADLRAGILAAIGATYWRQGNRDEGIRYFKDAAKTLETTAMDVRVEELLSSYLGSTRRVYFELLVDMLAKEGRTEEAFGQAERARARAFLQLLGNHRLNAEHGADPRLIREAEMLRTDIIEREQKLKEAPPEERARLTSDLQLERDRYASVLTRAKASSPEYAALTTVEPLEVDAVRRDLPPDVTLISYFVTTNGIHAWVIDAEEAHHALLRLDGPRLQRIVCWADGFGTRQNARGVVVPSHCSDAATAGEAFDQLVGPIAKSIRHQKLVIVPHGVLHYIPFAALRNRATGHDLIDDYTLTYAPSASTLRFLRAKETPIRGTALILGNPESPLPNLPALPGAEQEAKAVARTLDAKPHLGADARESLIHGLAGQSDVVHLAAHGLYDADSPLFSRIVLAAGEGHDGSLTVDEILSSVDLSGVNLVVLSACSTAVGARSGGDEVVGLTRALLYAGTPAVLSTIWNIDDSAAAGLMDEFYRRLANGATAADALRQAQLAIKKTAAFADPKYWAAFMLHGDPQGRWKGGH